MKKTVSILLTLLLVLALLPAPSLAAEEAAVLSGCGLRVDGKSAACRAYDIGGETWFRLRDVAQALNATGSRFSVSWDAEARAVTLTTGEAYEPDGSEGAAAGGAAVPSGQVFCIDGEAADLVAWNIGGHNYFRLADLAPALGFQADWDEASGTAIIRARVRYEPTPWLTQELYVYDNSGTGAWHHEVATYDSAGRQLTNLSEGLSVIAAMPEGVETRSVNYFYYDALGRRTEYATDHLDGQGQRVSSTFEYDVWGQLVRNGGGELNPGSANTFSYDDRGNLTAQESSIETPAGQMTGGIYMEYDENDHITKSVMVQDGVTVSHVEYVNDSEGNVLREEYYDPDGNLTRAVDHEYDGGQRVRSVRSGDYAVVTTYGYDEEARTYTTVTEAPTGTTTTVNTLDEGGRPLRQETVSGDMHSVTTWEYDEAGRLLRQVNGDPASPDSLRSCTYDGEGNILTDVYEESSGYREETVYEYDPALRKMVKTRTTTYPEAAEIVLYNGGSVTLPAGEKSFLHWYFLPHNALAAAIDWVSSDESIATVDASGVVTGVAPGEATITGTSERNPLLTVTCTVTVTK